MSSRRARNRRHHFESLEVRRLLATVTVTNNNDTTNAADGVSLREAINAINAGADGGDVVAVGAYGSNDTINFNIPAAGVQTIQVVAGGLPVITKTVQINGYTQPLATANTLAVGDDANLLIELDGTNAGAVTNGLSFRDNSDGSSVRGLIINRFDGTGISAGRTSDHTFAGNFIGTDSTGTLARANVTGIVLSQAGNCVVGGTAPADRNLISGNSGDGINPQATGASGNLIQGNYIGTTRSGIAGLGNLGSGIHVQYHRNTIGGTTPGARNVICFNGGSGVRVDNVDENIISGNFIGVGADGTTALGNTEDGVHIDTGTGTIIGSPGAGNVISANGGNGIGIANIATGTPATKIQSNLIGLDATGAEDRGNGERGIFADDCQTSGIIGGPNAGEGNVISGNGSDGIFFNSSDVSTIQGNIIGLNAAGNVARPNDGDGVAGRRADQLVIGGVIPGAGNIISGNKGSGIGFDDCAFILIQGNRIGVLATGATGPGNGLFGVFVGNRCGVISIGGPIPAAGNIIAFNIKDGVAVVEQGSALIRLNSIFSNGELGIDLQDDGVTFNDPGDPDGATVLDPIGNEAQNFPVLAFAQSSGSGTTVQGGLNSESNQVYLIDFYTNDAFDPTLSGEGQTYLGSVAVTTDFAGNAVFNPTFPTIVPAGKYISATATTTDHAPDGETSEFSQVVQVVGPPLPPPPPPAPSVSINDVSKAEGNAGTTAFTFTLTRSGDLTSSSIVSVSTGGGSALAPTDYASQSNILVAFAPNSPTATFTVNVNGDPNVEPDENFFVNVTSVTNATIGDGQGQGTIQNDDPPPTISIDDVSKSEGNGGTTAYVFTLTRTGDLSVPSTISWSTADGSAAAPTDYGAVPSTQVTFIANQATAQVTVYVNGDTTVETDESFFVNLASVSNATFGKSQGVGTIKNDDIDKPKCEYGIDPCDPKKTSLCITGTDAGERIEVYYGGSQGKCTVKINGSSVGTFSFTGNICVYGKGGNDFVGIDSKITRNAYIFCGDGNDTCYGGGGGNVIVGGRGNDNCYGGSNRDLCIGGEGSDNCDGGSGDDCIIAGCSTIDDSLASLCNIQKEWCRTDKDYKTRYGNVKAGAGYCAGTKFCETSIADDSGIDTCKGGSGSDAFFCNTTGGTYKDKLSDKSSSENLCELV